MLHYRTDYALIEIAGTLVYTITLSIYRKVVSSNMSRLEAHAGFFRLLMKGILMYL